MNQNNAKAIKLVLIFISILMVLFSFTQSMFTSNKGGSLNLFMFESFYVYLICIVIAVIKVFNNKNASIPIILSILTYLWTYVLVNAMFRTITDVQITIHFTYYTYLCSVIFLIISLFINPKLEGDIVQAPQENNESTNTDFDSNHVFFSFFLSGIKEVPMDTVMLLIHNTSDHSLDIIYNLTNNDQDNITIKIPISDIKNLSYITKVRMQDHHKKVIENETMSMLLSAVTFSGPLMIIGKNAFNGILDTLSSNYNKVDYNTFYEIILEATYQSQDLRLVFTTDKNPESFIQTITKNES